MSSTSANFLSCKTVLFSPTRFVGLTHSSLEMRAFVVFFSQLVVLLAKSFKKPPSVFCLLSQPAFECHRLKM